MYLEGIQSFIKKKILRSIILSNAATCGIVGGFFVFVFYLLLFFTLENVRK